MPFSRALVWTFLLERSLLCVPDPRIQDSVQKVYNQIDGYDEHSNDHDLRLNHRIVPLEDGLNEDLSHAWNQEDGLDDYRPTEQPGKYPTGCGQNRQEGVLESVSEYHHALA